MKLTDKRLIQKLKNGEAIREPNMPAHVFIKSDGKRIYISDWGQDMGVFKPTIKALIIDTWYVADEENE